MNANEMADLMILFDSGRIYEHAEEIATMLRQQQAELDAFKLQYYNTGYSLQLRDKDETIRQQQSEIEALKKEAALQRLSDFTQEATKTLTDEEIDAVGDEVSNLIDTYAGRREFARTILRKAQEK